MNDITLIHEFSGGYMLTVEHVGGSRYTWSIRNGKLVDAGRVQLSMDDALTVGRITLNAWARDRVA